MTIGRIRRVPLREVWPHEAFDFTRWLQENMDILNEVLSIELTSLEREQRAGDFSVDLVGEDQDGQPVVIENQLGSSDHDHLGKLLTYLAAFEAKNAVWVVAKARSEHVSAVSWLNESTSAAFHLVQAEAIRIDDSPPAALLTVIVEPSVEGRSVGEKKRELSERQRLRYEFWEELLGEARKRTQLHGAISPSTASWISAGAGLSGLGYVYAIQQHTSRVELFIDRKEAELSKAVYDAFENDREAIEREFGGKLIWTPPSESRQSGKIAAEQNLGGWKDDAETWEVVREAMIDEMMRLELALRPRIQEIATKMSSRY